MSRPIDIGDIAFAGGALQSALDAEASLRNAVDVGLSAAITLESATRSSQVLSLDNLKQSLSARGQVNGYCSLDAAGKVPFAQLPVGSTAGSVCAGDDPRLAGGGGLVRVAGNFAFGVGGVGWDVLVNLSSANIVGTLPNVIPDGQVARVFAEGVAGGSANRFSFGLGPNTFNGGVVGFGNASSDCSQGSVAASLAALGATLTASAFASWSPNQINLANDDNPGEVTFTIVGGPGGGGLTFTVPTLFLSVFRNGVNLGAVNSVPLLAGLNTIRILRNATPAEALDNFAATNVAVPIPSLWTDVVARNVGPSGYVELEGVAAVPTWLVKQRLQFGL